MQMKHTKGLFIDSSYRRVGLLKTLLKGFRSEREEKEAGGRACGQDDRAFSSPSALASHVENDNTHMKKVASL
jgi:hypothetical protein